MLLNETAIRAASSLSNNQQDGLLAGLAGTKKSVEREGARWTPSASLADPPRLTEPPHPRTDKGGLDFTADVCQVQRFKAGGEGDGFHSVLNFQIQQEPDRKRQTALCSQQDEGSSPSCSLSSRSGGPCRLHADGPGVERRVPSLCGGPLTPR